MSFTIGFHSVFKYAQIYSWKFLKQLQIKPCLTGERFFWKNKKGLKSSFDLINNYILSKSFPRPTTNNPHNTVS